MPIKINNLILLKEKLEKEYRLVNVARWQKEGEALTRICDNHDLPRLKIHGFRHTHCSLLFEAILSVKEVQDRLGHSDVQTTLNIYIHVTKKQKDVVAEKFSNYINF